MPDSQAAADDFALPEVDAGRNDDVNGTPVDAPDPVKNPHAVALGKLGGSKGGRARAEKLSAVKRRTLARRAAKQRWKKGSGE
jgi:hypothetical protein